MAKRDLVLRSNKGSPLTNNEMDANWTQLLEFMNSVHIVDGANLNAYDFPGVFHMSYNGGTSLSWNYPILQAGMLRVWNGVGTDGTTAMLYQEYTSFYPLDPRVFIRTRYQGEWGPWKEMARRDNTMRVVPLTSATDFNTLAGENCMYTWGAASYIVNGPPSASGTVGAGYMYVENVAPGLSTQRCVLLINGQKPRVYVRMGTTGAWEQWFMVGPLSSTAYLPIANCGDIYVDGFGWCRWNSSAGAYSGNTPVTGSMELGAGTTVWGNFPGQDTNDANIFRARSGTTYLQAVPAPDGTGAGILVRGAKSPNAQFAMLAIDSLNGVSNLIFSRHGTAAVPSRMIIASATGECGTIWEDGSWRMGRTMTPNVTCRLHISYIGGSTMYGLVLRPTEFASTTAIQFQQYNGLVAGYIQCQSDLSTIYATTSDYRSKDELGELVPEDSLNTVLNLRPISYRMKAVPVVMRPSKGFVAHELQEHIPQAVTGQKDEVVLDEDGNETPKFQGVDLGHVVPDLVGAVKALHAMVLDLQEEVRQLKAEKTK